MEALEAWARFIGAVGIAPAIVIILLLRLEPLLRQLESRLMTLEKAILLLVMSNGTVKHRREARSKALEILGVGPEATT